MDHFEHLERAEEELERANEHAGSIVRKQINSVEEGVFEEVGGERTQDAPGPKADRVAELEKKLVGLLDEADDPARTHIARAREHLEEYRRQRT